MINKSEQIDELGAALSKFQAVITNPINDAKNPQFNSQYATLETILTLVRPTLGKFGLSILQSCSGTLESVNITTMLLHSSGQYIETEPFMLKGEQTLKGGGKTLSVQGAASMITYAKRYQISAILGINSESDDDGNHASKAPEKTPAPAPAKLSDTKSIMSEAEIKRLYSIATEKGYTALDVKGVMMSKFKIGSANSLNKEQYDQMVKGYESLKQKGVKK